MASAAKKHYSHYKVHEAEPCSRDDVPGTMLIINNRINWEGVHAARIIPRRRARVKKKGEEHSSDTFEERLRGDAWRLS